MEIGPDKTKVMVNNQTGFNREIKIKVQRLEVVENFKYLGSIIANEGSKPHSFQDCQDNSSSFYTEDHMEGKRISILLAS